MDRRMATWDGYAILILLVSAFAMLLLTPYGLIFLAINGPKDWVVKKKKKYVRL